MYLGALVFRNDKVTRYQYAYNNLKIPNVTTAFGRRSFSFAFPFEWNKLPYEMKLIPHEFDYLKKLKTGLLQVSIATISKIYADRFAIADNNCCLEMCTGLYLENTDLNVGNSCWLKNVFIYQMVNEKFFSEHGEALGFAQY